MTVQSQVAPQTEAVTALPSMRRYYVLALLTLVYSVNFLDRTVFNVLIDPIKKELGLSDTVMGLIAGPGFIFFYAVTGIPFARLADRFSRRNLVAAATVLWSVMTALCGTAQSAVSLAIARVGVGIGEAGSGPASHSMISDLFSKIERVRALGVYALGVSLGSAVGYASGGWLNQHYGWRMAFFCAGLPGLIAALLLLSTSSEPQRGAQESNLVSLATQSFKQTLAFLWRQKTFVLVACGFCFTALGNYTIAVWIPSFLVRVHHLTSAQTGGYAGFAAILGIGGAFAGGFVTSWFARRDDRWQLWTPAIAVVLWVIVNATCMLVANFDVMVTALFTAGFLGTFHLGPVFAVCQSVVPGRMRALAAALVTLGATTIGQGFGPLAAGMLNDRLGLLYGAEAVRYSMVIGGCVSLLGAICFISATRYIRSDLAEAHA